MDWLVLMGKGHSVAIAVVSCLWRSVDTVMYMSPGSLLSTLSSNLDKYLEFQFICLIIIEWFWLEASTNNGEEAEGAIKILKKK